MGFANLATIMSVISEVYSIDFQIRTVTQEKMAVARQARQFQMNPFANVSGFPPDVQKLYQEQQNAMAAVLYNTEKELDQLLEELKATRTALVKQKEEFQGYVKENIQQTFKNSYMG